MYLVNIIFFMPLMPSLLLWTFIKKVFFMLAQSRLWKTPFDRQCDGRDFGETHLRPFQPLLVEATRSPCRRFPRRFKNALARF